MANMIPSKPFEGTPTSEKRVFRLLEEQLDGSWTVLHSVPFLERERDRAHDGEIDFVLLHPQRGVLVLEVKGGQINVRDDRWTTTDGQGQVHKLKRSPFEQCRVAKYALRELIEGHLGQRHPRFVLGHAVAFPNTRRFDEIGADGKREVIWDGGGLENVEKALNGTLGYFGSLSSLRPHDVDSVVGLLRPTMTIGSRLHAAAEESGEKQIALTEEQVGRLRGLRGNPRAIITGGAGTGKTVLAIEHAKWLLSAGKSVGIFCFNEALGDHLKATFQPERDAGKLVAAGHIHGFMEETVAQAGLAVPSMKKADGTTDDAYYSSALPEAFIDAASQLDLQFDALVVDEAQDFEPDLLTRLELLLPGDEAQFFLFADERQNLFVEDWKAPFDGARFELTINCRNTQPIAEQVSKTIGRVEPSLEGAGGLPPQNMPAVSDEETTAKVLELIERLVGSEPFLPSQITVLSQRVKHRDALRGTEVAGSRFVTFEEANRGEDNVLVETIHKFKGLETDIAIVVLDKLTDERHCALAYVGMSRAKTLLFTISPPAVAKKLNGLDV